MQTGSTKWSLKVCHNLENLFLRPTFLTVSQTSPGFYLSAVQVFFETLWEKEKLLVMSNFSSSHSVFYPFGELSVIFIKFETVVWKIFQFGRVQNLSSSNGLTHSHTMTPFDDLGYKPFENTVGKPEIAHNEQFLLFAQCFLPVWITFCHFLQILNCHLQSLSIWKSLKLAIW